MTTREPTDNRPERTGQEMVETLREQTQVLLQEIPGPLRKVQVSAGDTAVTVEWAEPDEAAAPNGNGHQRQPPAPDGGSDGSGSSDHDGLVAVTAPLVGTFYRRPEPGAEPFVDVGSVVQAGETVAIVEAMKLMNPVTTSQAGKVVAIHPDDTEMVEYGQRLIDLEPAPEQAAS